MFLGVYAWMAAFVGNFSFGFLPTIDGPRVGPFWTAVFVDLVLIALFGVQHSVMARPTFKQWWTRYVPEPIERSTYVMISNVLMIAADGAVAAGRRIGVGCFRIPPDACCFMRCSHSAGCWSRRSSLMINHFDLFGTRQVWLHLKGTAYSHLAFRTPMAYRVVRHPLYVGWLIAFWATPTMSATHLLLAAGLSVYILIAIPFEERNLAEHYGEQYESYRRNVGGLVPKLKSALAIAERR